MAGGFQEVSGGPRSLRRFPGRSQWPQEAPMRPPGRPQEAPRRSPGGTQKQESVKKHQKAAKKGERSGNLLRLLGPPETS
jgi:hypothetical protein